jgi:hypothetical protein
LAKYSFTAQIENYNDKPELLKCLKKYYASVLDACNRNFNPNTGLIQTEVPC